MPQNSFLSEEGAAKSRSAPNTNTDSKKRKDKKRRIAWWAPLLPERTARITGLICLLLALVLFLSFGSYLFTWKADQDKIFHFSWHQFFLGDSEIANHMGRLGAYLAHLFIFEGLGVASFLLVLVCAAVGINLVLYRQAIALGPMLLWTTFALIYLPILSHLLFGQGEFPAGGMLGAFMTSWLTGFAGLLGTWIIVLFVPVILLATFFNEALLRFLRSVTAAHQHNVKPDFAPVTLDSDRNGYTEPVDLTSDRPCSAANVTHQVNTWLTDTKTEEISRSEENHPAVEIVDPTFQIVTENDDVQLDITAPNEESLADSLEDSEKQIDPTLDLPDYQYPPLDLLEQYGSDKPRVDAEELMRNKDQIVTTLRNYGIDIQTIKATVGPTVTLYEIVPVPGVRISKIKNLEDDIALSLSALGIRIIAPLPGKGTIGIEVPNWQKETVSMRTLLASEKFQHAGMELPVALGKTIGNEIFIADLAKMPHLLMAGATGQGKSVGVNALLMSLLFKKHPSQVKFVLIDPKKVELSLYASIEKHFLAKLPHEPDPIVVDTKKVVQVLKALTIEMEQRYDLLKNAQCRNIREYNEKFLARRLSPSLGHRFLPYIILVIDEFADLIMTAGKEIETPITRLAQLARAIGIHLIIATQRPSVNIITGTIKANFPARMAFKVTSKVDSRTILDVGGAEQLIGRGDMLLSLNGELLRLQCGFVDTPEVERVCQYIRKQKGYPQAHLLPELQNDQEELGETLDPNERDELFAEAARLVVQYQQGSTSLLQRRLKLGYNRAGRLMDQLEQAGIVGPNLGSKAREVIIKSEADLEQYLDQRIRVSN